MIVLEHIPTILLIEELRRRGVASYRPADMRAGLTRRQQEVYAFVRDEVLAGRPGPSYRDIARAIGSRSIGSTHDMVQRMVQRGVLIRLPHRARTLGLA